MRWLPPMVNISCRRASGRRPLRTMNRGCDVLSMGNSAQVIRLRECRRRVRRRFPWPVGNEEKWRDDVNTRVRTWWRIRARWNDDAWKLVGDTSTMHLAVLQGGSREPEVLRRRLCSYINVWRDFHSENAVGTAHNTSGSIPWAMK